MTHDCNAEINLDQLTGLRSFIVAADGQLTITWASEPVLRLVGHALGLKVSDIVEPIEPREEISPSSIARNMGMQYQILLKNGGCSTPLIGQWVSSRGGFILLASPDVRKPEDLDMFSFDDSPENDPTIKLLTTREEYITTLKEAKSAANALREARGHLEGVFAMMTEGLIVIEPDGQITKANPAAEGILGLARTEIEGRNYTAPEWEVLRPDGTSMPPDEMAGLRAMTEKRVVKDVKMGVKRPDGTITWINASAAPLTNKAGELICIIGIFSDITERKRLQEETWQLATIVEQTVEGIAVANLDGKIQFANHAWTAMHGYESNDELAGKHLSIFHTEEQLKTDVIPFNEQVKQRGYNIGEVGHMREDGTIFPTMMNVTLLKDEKGTPYAIAGFMQDITVQKRDEKECQILEMEMNQTRKLEAIGSLAAGIAHEINTPIQFVGDNTSFLSDAFTSLISLVETYDSLWQEVNTGGDFASLYSEKVKAEKNADLKYLKGEIPSAIEQSLDGVQRVTKIVRAMKDFAHSDQGNKSVSDINDMLSSCLTVCQNELKYVADIETDFDLELPSVECYRDDMNQVFLNLLINAAHAIEDVVGDASAGKGTITISTLRDNDNIIAKISDTGTGIPQSVRDRIFDPFFSTKDVGKGSGQGLSIARKIIVEKHVGSLNFETEEGKGTTFIIRLPITIPEVVEV